MSWDGFFLPHTVRVRALAGVGGMGAVHAAPVSVSAEVKDQQTLVRSAAGSEVVSSSQVTVPLEAVVPVGSLVTVWLGLPAERESEVIAVAANDNTDDPDLDSFQVLYLS